MSSSLLQMNPREPLYLLSLCQAMLIVLIVHQRFYWLLTRTKKKIGEVNAMGVREEKEVRAYRINTKAAASAKLVAEDVIHDSNPVYCVRCQKNIKLVP